MCYQPEEMKLSFHNLSLGIQKKDSPEAQSLLEHFSFSSGSLSKQCGKWIQFQIASLQDPLCCAIFQVIAAVENTMVNDN